jgi:predicted nucleic acid-binding protein
MILIDANLLLYAYNRASDQHERARVWLEEALAGTQSVLLPWPVVLAFLRISTSSRVWPKPLTIAEAGQIITTLLSFDRVTILLPGESTGRS